MRKKYAPLALCLVTLTLSTNVLVGAKTGDCVQHSIQMGLHCTHIHPKHLDLVVKFEKNSTTHVAYILVSSKTYLFYLRKTLERKLDEALSSALTSFTCMGHWRKKRRNTLIHQNLLHRHERGRILGSDSPGNFSDHCWHWQSADDTCS